MAKKPEIKKQQKPAGKIAVPVKKNYYWMPVVCIILAFIAFTPVFKAGFVNWDDPDYVINNPVIQSLANFKTIVTMPVQGNYHPLTMLTLAINYAISGTDAWSYHVVNLFLHLLNVLLVFIFIFRLTGKKPWAAFIAALLFAIHPLHVESVAWVAERKDVLYSFFFLAALVAYLGYLKKKTILKLIAVLALFLLSLLSKPAAIIFPVVLFAVDYYYNRLKETGTYLEKIPFILFSVIFGLLALHGQSVAGAVRLTAMIPANFKFFFGFYGIMMYLLKTILPFGLCTFYPYPAVNESLPFIYYVSPLVTVFLVILFFAGFRKNRLISFAILFYVINLALVLQFYPVGSAVIADRYTYIPLIGVFLVAGHYFQKWADLHAGKPPALAMALVIAGSLALSVLSFSQASTWKDEASLWDKAIASAPSSKAYSNRGLIYKNAGQKDKAIGMFTYAIVMNRAEKDALINRGDIYFSDKNYDLAIADYNQCLAISPDEQQAIQNRGAAYAAQGKYEPALADMTLALKLNPNSTNGYANRALLEQTLNQHQAAIDDFFRHMKITPDKNGDVWNAIGISYLRMGNNAKALECIDHAITLTKNPVFLKNRELVESKLRGKK